jgi:filamentous hemagglutinin
VVTTTGSPSRTSGTPDPFLSEADYAGRGTVRVDLTDHIVNPTVSGRKISGGHELNNFNMALNDAGGTILSSVEKGPGIYEIQYQLPNSPKPAIKTVYDANTYPNMESMANLASARALMQNQITGVAEQKIIVD